LVPGTGWFLCIFALPGAGPNVDIAGCEGRALRSIADRLLNVACAMYHWARVAVQHDPRSRSKYAALAEVTAMGRAKAA